MNPAYDLKSSKDIQILSVKSLLNEYTNRDILQAAQKQIDFGFCKFVVDLANMPYTNSVGLNFLISLQARCKEQGGDMVVANVSTKIMQLLEVTKLHDILNLSDTVEDGFRQIQQL